MTLEIEKEMDSIDVVLESQNTDVISELNNYIEELELLRDQSSKDEIEKIDNQINVVGELIRDYESYMTNKTEHRTVRGSFHAVYSPAVAAVIAYFNNKGYKLAAELLAHARDNNSNGSSYTPIYKSIALDTREVRRIMQGPNGASSSSFDNYGSTNDVDSYYAIHLFNYYKNGRSLSITDLYNYEQANEISISGVAIDTMYWAEQMGVIVPYNVVINANL